MPVRVEYVGPRGEVLRPHSGQTMVVMTPVCPSNSAAPALRSVRQSRNVLGSRFLGTDWLADCFAEEDQNRYEANHDRRETRYDDEKRESSR